MKPLRSVAIVTATVWLCASRALAGAGEWFPARDDIFEPLRADPRELHYGARAVAPIGQHRLGEVAIGDLLQLYRGRSSRLPLEYQASFGGGIFARFDLAAKTNDMEVADFYANVPFDVRSGPWSGRFLLYHTSSHLGDDYIAETGLTTTKHTWDSLRWLGSYRFGRSRAYAGLQYAFRSLPGGYGRTALQGGFEVFPALLESARRRIYWANDLQSWEKSRWNLSFTSQLGLELRGSPERREGITVFVEFGAGSRQHGQFFRDHETRWAGGMKFRLS